MFFSVESISTNPALSPSTSEKSDQDIVNFFTKFTQSNLDFFFGGYLSERKISEEVKPYLSSPIQELSLEQLLEKVKTTVKKYDDRQLKLQGMLQNPEHKDMHQHIEVSLSLPIKLYEHDSMGLLRCFMALEGNLGLIMQQIKHFMDENSEGCKIIINQCNALVVVINDLKYKMLQAIKTVELDRDGINKLIERIEWVMSKTRFLIVVPEIKLLIAMHTSGLPLTGSVNDEEDLILMQVEKLLYENKPKSYLDIFSTRTARNSCLQELHHNTLRGHPMLLVEAVIQTVKAYCQHHSHHHKQRVLRAIISAIDQLERLAIFNRENSSIQSSNNILLTSLETLKKEIVEEMSDGEIQGTICCIRENTQNYTVLLSQLTRSESYEKFISTRFSNIAFKNYKKDELLNNPSLTHQLTLLRDLLFVCKELCGITNNKKETVQTRLSCMDKLKVELERLILILLEIYLKNKFNSVIKHNIMMVLNLIFENIGSVDLFIFVKKRSLHNEADTRLFTTIFNSILETVFEFHEITKAAVTKGETTTPAVAKVWV